MTRSPRRRLAVPAVAAALALPVCLLASCSSSLLAETALETSGVPGAVASVRAGTANETIQFVNATVDYNGPKGYAAGDTAPLSLWIFNNTTRDITLTGVRSDAGQVMVASGTAPGVPSACQSSGRPILANPSTGAPTAGVGPSMGASGGISPQGPTGTPSNNSSTKPTGRPNASGSESGQPSLPARPSQSGSARPGQSGSPEPGGSGSAQPSGSTSASPSAAPGSTDINVGVKADGCVALNRQGSQFLEITGLADPVQPGKSVNMIFTFQQAGGGQFVIGSMNSPVAVPMNVPNSPDRRAPAVAPGPTE